EALVRGGQVRIEDGTAELVGPAVPVSLAAAIGARLDFLSERARPVLRIAALLGPGSTVEDLSVAAGQPASELADVIDEAILAGVLLDDSPEVVFRHGLIRAALYEQIPPGVRAALHRQAARALARSGAGVEVVAQQLLAGAGGATGTEEWAVDWLAGSTGTAL